MTCFGVMLIEEAEKARRFRARRIEIIKRIVQQVRLIQTYISQGW